MIYESEAGLIKETVPKKGKYFLVLGCLFVAALLGLFAYLLYLPPSDFNTKPDESLHGLVFEVKDGDGGNVIAGNLKEKGIIISAIVFRIYSQALNHSKNFKAGMYLFEKPLSVIEAESRLTKGDFRLPKIKITFPEGFTARQVTDRLAAQLPLFDKNKFWAMASSSEGYLFPETYFFVPGEDEHKLLGEMIFQFSNSTRPLHITEANKKGIITMASILQKEVRGADDMKIVSGIFWKRLKMKMALQADSTLDYELNKTSAELTAEDLKRDTRYNTYTRKGLPPTPIDNPGLDAIKAALTPTTTEYLYFLTGKDGKVYYAKTFEEHKANKAKYL